MIFLIYLWLFLLAIVSVAIFLIGAEFVVGVFMKNAPEVPSGLKLRMAIVKQIKKEFPNAKTIFDIGSGWGTMARTLAKSFPSAKLTGVEMMPTPFIYSIIRGLFIKNIRFIFGNAFKYLKKHDEIFDVGIAYLLTPMMKSVQNVRSKFKLLLVLDFPLPDIKPSKKIKLHKDRLGQHWLYVYKQ